MGGRTDLTWLNQFRRLRVRYEKRADIHEAFLSLGYALTCWRFLRIDDDGRSVLKCKAGDFSARCLRERQKDFRTAALDETLPSHPQFL